MQNQDEELNIFLKSVEQQAYRIALLALRNEADALDAVQEAMTGLCKKYASRPTRQWKPLFYKILNSRIIDTHRKTIVKSRLFGIFTQNIEDQPAAESATTQHPEKTAENTENNALLNTALQELPHRQRQAFLLRHWEEMSVKETAQAMGCSTGAVKTHTSRAISSLQHKLEQY
ncbi:MAG: RNA polymerase sigma factor [Desulfovibrio sp.]